MAKKAPIDPETAKLLADPASPEERDLRNARIDDAVLALLLLGYHDGGRVWKGFDWDALDRLHRNGFISDPVGKAKSVVLTEEGEEVARKLFRALFMEGRPPGS